MKTLPEQPTALKPCPFCGGEAEIMRNGKNQLTLKCVGAQPSGLRGCGMGYSQKYGIRLTEDGLAAIMVHRWNTRADAAPDTSAEAVAWRGRYISGEGKPLSQWVYIENIDGIEAMDGAGKNRYQIEPLYLPPPTIP